MALITDLENRLPNLLSPTNSTKIYACHKQWVDNIIHGHSAQQSAQDRNKWNSQRIEEA